MEGMSMKRWPRHIELEEIPTRNIFDLINGLFRLRGRFDESYFIPSGNLEAGAAAVTEYQRAIPELISPDYTYCMLPNSTPGFYGIPAHTLLIRPKDPERKDPEAL
jgi:hypothetical protein